MPRDVSIVGFDDIPEAAHVAPPLTTMRQDFDQLGHDIMGSVLGLLNDEEAGQPHRMPLLVRRESTRARHGPPTAPATPDPQSSRDDQPVDTGPLVAPAR